MTGGNNFVSLAAWPKPDEAKVDVKAEENEALIMNTLEDTLNITKATGITAKKIFYYVASPWKWKTYMKALERSVSEKVVQRDLMKDLMTNADLKAKAEHVAKFASQIVDEVNKLSNDRRQRLVQVGAIEETQALKEAENFFKRELKAEIYVYGEDDTERYDPKSRAQLAKPYRPAIYIE